MHVRWNFGGVWSFGGVWVAEGYTKAGRGRKQATTVLRNKK